MLNKKDILNISSVGIKLFLITAISAMILAFTNNLTEPIIIKNAEKKQEESMKKVMSDAVSFERAETDNLVNVELQSTLTSVYKGLNSNSETIGYVAMVEPKGYGGEISLAVGIDNDLKVTGVDVISHSETPGLGAKCVNEEFKNQFIGKSIGVDAVKSGAKENQIDAITSATITSKAVTSGVNTAVSAVNLIKEAK